jgi:hypothetical protein
MPVRDIVVYKAHSASRWGGKFPDQRRCRRSAESRRWWRCGRILYLLARILCLVSCSLCIGLLFAGLCHLNRKFNSIVVKGIVQRKLTGVKISSFNRFSFGDGVLGIFFYFKGTPSWILPKVFCHQLSPKY